MISTHRADVRVAGIRLDVIDLSVTLDDLRAPYATATITAQIPSPEDLEVLDPRQDQRMTIRMVQEFGAPFPLSRVTAEGLYHSGLDTFAMSDLTALFCDFSRPVHDITTAFGRSYVPPVAAGPPTGTSRGFNLFLRSRQADFERGVMTLTAASDESRLQDYRLVSSRDLAPAGGTLRDSVELALRYGAPGATVDGAMGAQLVDAGVAIWPVGVSAWDYLTPITASLNARLWCDESGLFHLEDPTTILRPDPIVLADDGRMVNLQDTVDRDGDWHDGVVVAYIYTDPATGTTTTRYDVAGSSTGSRRAEYVEYRDRPYPGRGEAAARLRRLRELGRTMGVEASSQYDLKPPQRAHITAAAAGLVDYQMDIATVEWSQPADRMRLFTRDIYSDPTA